MDFWAAASSTVAAEFADLSDVRQLVQLVVRLLMAAVLGGLVGLEREMTGKPAGLRTHMLLSMGAAMFVLVPLQTGFESEDLGRVIQGLLAGVGLLCAGSILKSEGDERIQGLTTAAGLWMTAAIGIAAGLGRETSALVSTLLTLAVLRLEEPVRRMLRRREG